MDLRGSEEQITLIFYIFMLLEVQAITFADVKTSTTCPKLITCNMHQKLLYNCLSLGFYA